MPADYDYEPAVQESQMRGLCSRLIVLLVVLGKAWAAEPPPPAFPAAPAAADLGAVPGPHAARLLRNVAEMPSLLGEHELLLPPPTDDSLEFQIYDLTTGQQRRWTPAIDPQALGWPAGTRFKRGYGWRGTGDPRTVTVGGWMVDVPGTGQWYPIVLFSDTVTGQVRRSVLVEGEDGGPHLGLSRDGTVFYKFWGFACEPTAAGYHHWEERAFGENAVKGPTVPHAFDGWSLAADAGMQTPLESEFLSANPWSDYVVCYDDGEDYRSATFGKNETIFARVARGRIVPTLRRLGLKRFDLDLQGWAAPELMFASYGAGRRFLIDMQGKTMPLRKAVSDVHPLTYFADGRCLFTQGAYGEPQLGRIDWRAGTISGRIACPALAAFAKDSDWHWQLLRDRTALLVLHDTDLYLIQP
jgi:hypothetical protein